MKAARVFGSVIVLAILLPAGRSAIGQQESPAAPKPSAAAIFEQTLAEQGLDAAKARLREIIADTTGAYAIDPYELLRGLPSRLRRQGKSAESLALLETLEPLFGKMPRYWPELGNAYMQADDAESARSAFRRAVDMDSTLAEVAWIISNLDRLMAITRIQIAAEGKHAPGESTGLQGPYLGQTPPGPVPEVFAPGIVNTVENEYSIAFTPDGREIYFSRGGTGTLVTRWTDDGWTAPERVDLIDTEHVTEEASVAPDGERIYFCGRAGLRDERQIYVAPRAGAGWGAPVKLFPGMYPTATLSGALYYTDGGQRPDYGRIVRRLPADGGFGEPELIPGEINSPMPDAHPWIAPDESFMIFDTYRQPGAGLYIAFRGPDGSWGRIIPLCDRLHIPPVGQGALTPDGKYLFFSMAGDMYWVDAGFLADLKHME